MRARALSFVLIAMLVLGTSPAASSATNPSIEPVPLPPVATSVPTTATPVSAESTSTAKDQSQEQPPSGSKADLGLSSLTGGAGIMPLSAPVTGLLDINQPLGGGTIDPGDEAKIVVIGSTYYQAYTGNLAGLSSALADLATQSASAPGDYVLYVGTTTAFALDATTLATGFALPKVGTLVITGKQETAADVPSTPVPAMTATATNGIIGNGGNQNINFGCNVILRNLRYNFTNVYMNGYDLTLGNQSWAVGDTSYYGGAASGTVNVPGDGTATMTVWSTGTSTGSTVDSTFVGGMYQGTMNGNAQIIVHNTSNNRFNIWGAGYGTNAANPANLNGSATSTIDGMSGTSGTNGLGSFVGGAYYGDVTGKITNTISGPGTFATNVNNYYWGVGSSQFIGGSYQGNIGTNADIQVPIADMEHTRADVATSGEYIIKSNIDTSAWTYGRASFCGANAYGGTVKGNVSNIVKAGTYSQGSLSTFQGLGGNSTYSGGTGGTVTAMTNAFNFNSANGKITGMDAAIAAAKSGFRFQAYGNVTSIIRSGCVASGPTEGYLRGTGASGYIEGSAYTMVGTEGLVWCANYDATNPTVGTAKDTVAGAGGDMTYMYSNAQTAAPNNNGQSTGFDLFGTGGWGSINGSQLVNGNATLVQENVRARWTYGGAWGGCQIGDTRNELWRGIVDTLEGAGYDAQYHVGNSQALVYGGQIDFFLSGDGWTDNYEDGNSSVTEFDNPRTRLDGTPVLNGTNTRGLDPSATAPAVIVNCSMGGSYGSATPHTISGNSTIMIYGGDFSGTAGHGQPNGFCTSATNAGTVYGNGLMTLDFRGNKYGFAIEQSDSVSAGRPANTNTPVIGTDGTQTLTLNVFSDANSKANLNGLNLYGDAATTAPNSRIGKITMNINAPGANLGYIYATRYSNISGGTLLRDVTINLVSADQIQGLSAGNITDNFTNAVASASAAAGKYAVIHVGPQSSDPNNILGGREPDVASDGYPTRINVIDTGIKNFTSMDVTKRLLVAAGTGSILNGANATASATPAALTTNHAGTYDQFGNVTLSDQSGLGVTGSGKFIVGALTVNGTGYVASTGAPAQIVVSDSNLNPNDDTNNLVWLRYGSAAAMAMSPVTSYFGINTAWPVLTFNSSNATSGSNALKVSPTNLTGVEPNTGKTYIGDNNVPNAANYGNGVALPGSVYRWAVTAGKGAISYHVDGDPTVDTTLPTSGYLDIFGSSHPDTPSQSGSMAIPSSKGILPTFSFIPDQPSESWVKGVQIVRSDHVQSGGAGDYSIPEQTLSDYMTSPSATQTWTPTAPDTSYSFDIKAQFSEKAEVTAKSVIMTESEAQALMARADVALVTSAQGRPFFNTSTIMDAAFFANLHAPLGTAPYRSVPVTWIAGSSGNTQSITVNIVIVPDGSIISADKSAALTASDATVTVPEARAIADQSALDAYTKAQAIVVSAATTTTPGTVTVTDPTLTDAAGKLATIQGASGMMTVPLAYSYSYTDDSGTVRNLTKDVTLTIRGGLITGTLFEDTNNNGVKDASETTVFAGKTVKLYLASDLTTPVKTTTTDTDGYYSFEVNAGSYVVQFPDLSAYGMTTTNPLTRETATKTVDFDATYDYNLDGGYVWPDTTGLADSLSKQIYDPASSSYVNSRTLTDSSEVLDYRIQFTLPSDLAGYSELVITDQMAPGLLYASGESNPLTLSVGGSPLTVDPSRVSEGSTTSGGMTYTTVSYTITDFTGLAGKTIDMNVKAKLAKVGTPAVYPTDVVNTGILSLNPSSDSDLTGTDPSGPDIDVPPTPGPTVKNKVLISGNAYYDLDDSGTKDAGEDFASGVVVSLRDSSGAPILDSSSSPITATTDAGGNYMMYADAGTYTVRFSGIAGYTYRTTAPSDAIDAAGNTATFTADLDTHQQVTKNVSYIPAAFPTLSKQVLDASGDPGSALTISDVNAPITYRLTVGMPEIMSAFSSIEIQDVLPSALTLVHPATPATDVALYYYNGATKVMISDATTTYSGGVLSVMLPTGTVTLATLANKTVYMDVTTRLVVTTTMPSAVTNTAKLILNNTTEVDPDDEPPIVSVKGKISGILFGDVNKNGVYDSGDVVLGGKAVQLLDASNTVVATTSTASDGSYSFAGLDPASYKIQAPSPTVAGYDGYTTQQAITVADGSHVGNTGISVTAVIDRANSGANLEHTRNAGYANVAYDANDFTKALTRIDGQASSGPVTDSTSDLSYDIAYVMPDNTAGYNAVVIKDIMDPGLVLKGGAVSNVSVTVTKGGTAVTGWTGVATYDVTTDPTHPTVIYTFDPATDFSAFAGATITMTVVANIVKTGTPAAYPTQVTNKAVLEINGSDQPPVIPPPVDNTGRISGTVFSDTSRDGIWQTGESGISGVAVKLMDSTGTTLLKTATTDSNGKYSFDVAEGTYTVVFPPVVNTMGRTTTPTSGIVPDVTITLGNAASQTKTVDSGYALPGHIPDLADSFSKTVDDGSGSYTDSATVTNSTDPLKYKLSFTFPTDMTGYSSIELRDVMPAGLTLSATPPDNVVVKVGSVQVYSGA
ncbi:MAG: isopeptide-forming domain-containing fimbrial protein, partial [Coriobacteriia bacterium]|nr:isopeptide-forming domain-containing fimbrial protein [Coriobacteriia bacterium]